MEGDIKRIMTIVGARPQFIKASAVSKVIGSTSDVSECLVHTGQHYDSNMSDKFFEELGIPVPSRHLGIGSGGHGAQTGAMLAAIEHAILEEVPDWVLVYGDTNSTLAGALAAAKLHVPVAHVEAGLRSYNRKMPEEINRVLTDHVSELLFSPSEDAVTNLAKEGISGNSVLNVGDVMYDVAIQMADRANEKSSILLRLGLSGLPYILCTIHRAENTDEPDRLRSIANALSDAADHVAVVLPIHPRTKSRLEQHDITFSPNVLVVEPLGYLDMTALLMGARLAVTDSGGLQKEAFFHGIPCLTVREETEWTELVTLGWNRLVTPTSRREILSAILVALDRPIPDDRSNPYGNGRTAEIILQSLVNW